MEYETSRKILDGAALERKLALWRFKEHRIVFTNGCFDLLHLGHVDYLERARALGSLMVVGLNTDASVRRLKGPGRPLQPQESRLRVVAALQFVDAVVLFDADTPLELIRTIRPQVLAKGDDYSIESIVGAADVLKWGGSVQTIPLVPGFSTTNIERKIREGQKGC